MGQWINMENCDHNCESCASKGDCDDKKSMLESTNALSNVGKVIAIVSGKGGVGKSLITAMLACETRRQGGSVAILDADITGASVPKMFGLKDKAVGDELGLYPIESRGGIKVMSANLLLENANDPVLWRGPLIAGMVKQFWTDVIWGDVNYMYVDMPPGTGDVPLTVFQSIKVDGIIIVTSPQDLVSMIVGKAVKMANKMNIPILGLVENYSYITCPHCGDKIEIFGKSKIDSVCEEFNLKVLARMPIDPKFAALCDEGNVEDIRAPYLTDALKAIL